MLRANGYRTLALTGGATIAGTFGFARGFDIYSEQSAHITRAVGDQIERWLLEFGNGPFFFFLHTFEVHAPYRHLEFALPLIELDQRRPLHRLLADAAHPDGSWIPLIQDLRKHLQENGLYRSEITSALYDGGIAFVDRFLGELFDALRLRNLYDRTVIVVTSDHGEEFGEHDPARIYSDHCVTLYDELIHVPLIMRLPQQAERGRVVTDQVEIIDVAPTILGLLGIAPNPGMQGANLASLITGAAAAPRKDWALSEATCRGPELKALRTAGAKYVAAFDVGDGDRSGIPGPPIRNELFDLRADPREQNDRASANSDDTQRLQAQLEQIVRDRTARDPVAAHAPVGADVSERLRALGYMP
jgi:arylsulfatase A-like enzyme